MMIRPAEMRPPPEMGIRWPKQADATRRKWTGFASEVNSFQWHWQRLRRLQGGMA
jgi:hypothetical protein